MKAKILISLLSTYLLVNIIAAQPGTLDVSFGENGVVHRSFEYPSSKTYSGQAILETPDGKVLTAGISHDGGVVARFKADGSTDTLSPNYSGFFLKQGALVFDGGMWSAGNITIDKAAFYDIALQPDGKMVSVGYAEHTSIGSLRYILLRQNADGSYDQGFGGYNNGFSLGSYNKDSHAVAIQTDGKILVGATGIIARYLTNGRIDSSFATNGTLLIGPGINADMLLQPDGKILLAGGFVLAKVNSNGTLDSGFGTNGYAATDITSSSDLINSIELLPNGKILTIGRSGSNLAVARYDNNGQLDMDYGVNGVTIVESTDKSLIGNASALQSDGKLVVAGYAAGQGQDGDDFLLVRFTPEGTLDNSFGDGGLVISEISPKSDRLFGVDVQQDGKIIVTGYAGKEYEANSWGKEYIVARYLSGLEVATGETSKVKESLVLGPNPASDLLNFQLHGQTLANQEGVFQVLNLNGRIIKTVKSTRPQALHSLLLNGWPAGVYFLQYLENGEAKAVEKFVVMRE